MIAVMKEVRIELLLWIKEDEDEDEDDGDD